jgi:hypothetical protein
MGIKVGAKGGQVLTALRHDAVPGLMSQAICYE